MVVVAEELSADAQHHRAVAVDQRGEGGLGGGVAPGDEPFHELTVGQPGDRAAVEERLDLPGDRQSDRIRHVRGLP